MRFEASYSSKLSKRLKNWRCSVPCDSKYFWNGTDREENMSFMDISALISRLHVCTCLILTRKGLHLALTSRPALEHSFQSRCPRWKNLCLLCEKKIPFCLFTCVFVSYSVAKSTTCCFQSSCVESVRVFSPSWRDAPYCRESRREHR